MDRLDKRMLGRNIRQARCRLGLTQEQMAERIDMAPEVYGRLERGHLVPRLERFVTICRVLGETPDQLISREGESAGGGAPSQRSSAGAAGPMSALKRTLSDNMRKSRLRLGLTQKEMAARLDMSVDLYGRLERGTVLPALDGFVAICQVLGEESDELLGLPRARNSGRR